MVTYSNKYAYPPLTRRISLLLLLLPATPLLTFAVEPPLTGRGFYQEQFRKITTTYGPWVDLKSLKIDKQDREISGLRDWLIENSKAMATWPPRYQGERGAIQLIESWQARKPIMDKLGSRFLDTPDLGALSVTYWLYGHNLDEPDAANQAYALLDQLQNKFPDSSLPYMLRGMLLSRTGGPNAQEALEAARTRTTNAALLGLIDLTLSTRCRITGQIHQSVLALNRAMDECPACVRQYSDMPRLMQTSLGGSTRIKMEKPYYLMRADDGIIAGSHFFGFRTRLPGEWKPDGLVPFDPEKKPVSIFMLNAPSLAESKLVHGVVFVSSVVNDQHDLTTGFFMQTFSKASIGASATKIQPLIDNPYLTHWYRIDTRSKVGDNDTITMIAALGTIRPKTWSLSDHVRLAKLEQRCESPANRPQLGFAHMTMRIDAPIEFAIAYNASNGTYRQAEQSMKVILGSLEIEDHTASEVVARRLTALLNE